MKARIKSDGEIISVEAIVYNAKSGERYSPSELDFNVDAEGGVKDRAKEPKPAESPAEYNIVMPLPKSKIPCHVWDI